MRPDISARRMNSSGPISPCSGCSQRTSASTETTSPERRSKQGWKLSESWSSAMASRRWPSRLEAPDARAVELGVVDGGALAGAAWRGTWPRRPAPRATSASLGVVGVHGDADAGCGPAAASPSTSKGRSVTSSTRSATLAGARSTSALVVRRSANSSPPRRAMVSHSRSSRRSRSAKATSRRSPAWWPRASLTSLKSSRSSSSSATGSPVRRASLEGLLEVVGEQRPVGQAGEGVVGGLLAEQLLGLELVGDVDHDAAHQQRPAVGVPLDRRHVAHVDRLARRASRIRYSRVWSVRSPMMASRASCEHAGDVVGVEVLDPEAEARTSRRSGSREAATPSLTNE